jgi:hypothetical protein
MRIEAMETAGGNPAANQFKVFHDDGTVEFQSYGTTIAKIDVDGQVTLDSNYWDFSVTTGRYRNQFLGEGIKDTRKNIESGKYKLANLN